MDDGGESELEALYGDLRAAIQRRTAESERMEEQQEELAELIRRATLLLQTALGTSGAEQRADEDETPPDAPTPPESPPEG